MNRLNNLKECSFYGMFDKQQYRKDCSMYSSIPPHLIDFHSHYYETAWSSVPLLGSSVLTQAWPLLTDIQAQLAAMAEAGIDAKVLSAPAGVLKTTSEQLPSTLIERIN